MEKTIEFFRRQWSCAQRWIREAGVARLGWYTALALLLTGLGLASHAYRSRNGDAMAANHAPQPVMSVTTPDPLSSLVRLEEATPEPSQPPLSFVWPVEGEVIGVYADGAPVWSEALEQWQTHPALDIAALPGEVVAACADGVVTGAWQDAVWGNVVEIEHRDGYVSGYANLNTLNMVSVGDAVTAGQVIGAVGRSAVCEYDMPWHLHFYVKKYGKTVNFEDCMSFVTN